MFIKNQLAGTALVRSKQFSIFFLCRVIDSGLFFKQFYSWLPLFKILRPSFSEELMRHDEEVNKEIISYRGGQADKLLHGIADPLIRDTLLGQQIDGVGWGEDKVDRFVSYSLTVQVLATMLKLEGEDFFKTDVFKKSFVWIVDRWTQDLYHLHGLAFKGAIFLQLLSAINARGGDAQSLVGQSIIVDTFEYIEKLQSARGSWGFFFREFEEGDIDEDLGTPLMSSVVCLNLLASQNLLKNYYPEDRFRMIIDKGMAHLISNQHQKGFWGASSLDNFLKTLGWGIRFLQLYTK